MQTIYGEVSARTQERASFRHVVRHIPAYTFLLPVFIGWVAFSLYPIIESYRIVLYNWTGIGELERYVGLGNFAKVIKDQFFWKALRNSFVYAGVQVPVQLTLALVLALVLNSKNVKGRGVLRTLFFMPVLVSVTIVSLVMSIMLNPYDGVVNQGLYALGLINEPIHWLEEPRLAFTSIILVGIWHTMGYNIVYFLAALQAIPQEMYEAAAIDGSSGWRTIYYVTLPLIAPVALIILLLASLGSLNVMELVYVLTGGGPYFQTDVVQTYIFKFAFSGGAGGGVTNVGFASAAALFMSLLTLALSGVFFLVVRWVRRALPSR